MRNNKTKAGTLCYHCGDPCLEEKLQEEGKSFCCLGCKTVYQVLNQNELSDYYKIESHAGITQKEKRSTAYDFLDDEKLVEKLILFADEERSGVDFKLPQIHCSACVWLLERLYKFNDAIVESKVNFLKKEVSLVFDHRKISLREVAELLSSIGYSPDIGLEQLDSKRRKKAAIPRKLIYQIGLAGFAFGNIMLLSLPEYFGIDAEIDGNLSRLFNWLNLLLATPVAIYSGQDYFRSAWFSLKQKRLNIDVPIALGVAVLYLRSTYEIVSQTGSGYFDSLCGLLFFLLLGRLFQQKIYHQLSFERDYQSYFPIAVTQLIKGNRKSVPLVNLKKGDLIEVRNGELIPVDAILEKGIAQIDNSFISGESKLIDKAIGKKIFAGGRQVGGVIQLRVLKPLDQSRLTALWNRYANMNKGTSVSHFSRGTDQISQWFTPILLLIAFSTAIYHITSGWSVVFESVTSVLIVACPCALALAAPFAYGHAIRKAGRKGAYLRNAGVMENLAEIDHIVFDKTGTLTLKAGTRIEYSGNELNDFERRLFASLLSQSTHPLSKAVVQELNSEADIQFDHFEEIEGKGLMGILDGKLYQAGSAEWLGVNNKASLEKGSSVALSFEKEILGVFNIIHQLRPQLAEIIDQLGSDYKLSMLSGDNDQSRELLETYFPKDGQLYFEQSPEMKVEEIESLKKSGKKVAMIGDGLNDSAALKSANLGISIAEDVHAFAPASDIILEGEKFNLLPALFSFAKYARKVVWLSFGISFLYNIVGLTFAVQGLLSPVIAAILMPVSSISVVAFVSLANWLKPLRASS